jgi:kumamolisin
MSSHVVLEGSLRQHPIGSRQVGDPAPDELIQLTLVLRRRADAPEPDAMDRHLSHYELAYLYGADSADIQAVRAFALEHNFSIVRIHVATRCVTISGRLGDLASAFGADLALTQVGDKVLRTRQGHLHLPASLDQRVIAVLGFDQRPAAATYHVFRPRASQSVSYTPPQVAQLYNFPTNAGTGQTIALIELGGGFNDSDLESYWQQLGLSDVSVAAVSVDGAQNSPTGDPDGPDGEVVLDIEVAGSIAPGANIAVYFTGNTDQGFLDGINAAIHDSARKPSVISISWGAAESEWTPQSMNAFNAAFHDAALLGISVCVAAGDDGSSDGEGGGVHVDFPASSPWALACGGTTLTASNGTIKSEKVWNDGGDGGATGGGVSSHFSKPKYQTNISVPKPTGTVNADGRGVPDVAGNADPDTGYDILVDGEQGVIGGTSAVAPLWAGLIALLNQELGKNLGWPHNLLYGTITAHQALRDITSGNNGAYKASTGWDPCTGLGSPNGEAILNVLK